MDALRSRARTAALVCVDTGVYVAVVAAVTTVLAFVGGVATGGGFVRMKMLLFIAGFVLMAYSTARLWPRSPDDLDRGGVEGVTVPNGGSVPAPDHETQFESVSRRLPPARWVRPPPADRQIAPAGKLFWSSVAVLLTSYLMERVLGVGVV